MLSYQTKKSFGLTGKIKVASDKSISHRSLIFAALANGKSQIKNILLGKDVLRTMTILNNLGVKTSCEPKNLKTQDTLEIEGVGLNGFKKPKDILYCGNSGTTLRLMLGLLAGQNFQSILTGDQSLNSRPMDRVINPLKKMGAFFDVYKKDGQRLIKLGETHQKNHLKGIHYKSPIASAQVKSAILLAGLYAKGATSVTEPYLSRNHTELMLKSMGADLQVNHLTTTLRQTPLKNFNIDVPGDISSAAFFIVGALITKGSDLTIVNVSLNPTRTGLLDVLLKMGADISIFNQRIYNGESVGDLKVRFSELKNISISGAIIPRLIDELPILALAGAVSKGVMVVSGAGELRVKETDRILAICLELKKMGVDIQERPDGFVINGNKNLAFSQIKQDQLVFDSYGDHRMAMMIAIAGLLFKQSLTINDISSVKTSFPNFFTLLKSCSLT